MQNFSYYNPVKIIFGKGSIAKLVKELNPYNTILLTYGGGSIKKNGVYDQVLQALTNKKIIEFGGIEPNPTYETLMKAVELGRNEKIDFIIAVGGGSTIDGTKFISAAIPFTESDPWDLLSKRARFFSAIPFGTVLTIPATGSEMNSFSVISKKETREKLPFGGPLLYPKFSILDPETTYSLPERQTINGIVDAFVHVMEQYMTYPSEAPLQDRQSEAIFKTLIEEGPKVLENPHNYASRANIMWCATNALNGWIANGVVQDWTSHTIGHELTAFYGLDHAQTLAITLPAVLKHQIKNKQEKLVQYGKRVWSLDSYKSDEQLARDAIDKTEDFFRQIRIHTRLSQYGLSDEHFPAIIDRFAKQKHKLGEHRNIGSKEIQEILALCFR